MSEENKEAIKEEIKEESKIENKEVTKEETKTEVKEDNKNEENTENPQNTVALSSISSLVSKIKIPDFKVNKKEDSINYDSLQEKINSVNDSDTRLLAELLLELNKKQDVETKYNKRRAILSLFTSVLSLTLVIICMFILIPQITGLIKNLNVVLDNTNTVVVEAEAVVTQAQGVFEQTDVIIQNLEKTTNELAETDFAGMMKDVTELVDNSQDTLNEAMNKIISIDIDSLNKSIKDLGTVVEPMAKLFGGSSSSNSNTKKKSIFGF